MLTYTHSRKTTFDFAKIGASCLAIALIAFGIQHIFFCEFVIGRSAPLSDYFPGKVFWIFLSGIILLLAGICSFVNLKPAVAATISAILISIALLRNIATLWVADYKLGVELTNTGKSLALFGAFIILAGYFSMSAYRQGVSNDSLQVNRLIFIGRVCIALFLIVSGIQHFLFSEFVATLIPTWIPFKIFWTYFAGVALIAGGLGLLIKKIVYLTSTLVGVMIFTWLLLLHIPRALSINDANEWIAVVEALSFGGAAFLISGYEQRQRLNG
jgi:uncharacterized membrane protein